MTDPTIETILHDVETRIEAFAEEIASELDTDAITAILNRTRDSEQKDYEGHIWHELLVPALAWKTLHVLGARLIAQGNGWSHIFFKNLRERYAKNVPPPT